MAAFLMSLEFADPCCPLKWYVDLWCATLVDKVVDFLKNKKVFMNSLVKCDFSQILDNLGL